MAISTTRVLFTIMASTCLAWAQAQTPVRLDMGTASSPVAPGYTRCTAEDSYSEGRGYGWLAGAPRSAAWTDIPTMQKSGPEGQQLYRYYREQFGPLHRDNVSSVEDLVLRVDLPDGLYRVSVTVGDMSRALGSIRMRVNGELVEEGVAAWSPGTFGRANHRRLMSDPWGWWNTVRHTVAVTDGAVRIELSADQSYYDEMVARQETEEKAWELAHAEEFGDVAPYQRVGVTKAPYYYVGWPFVANAVTAVEIVPHRPPHLVRQDGALRLARPVGSPDLARAIQLLNRGEIEEALTVWRGIREHDAAPAKAELGLWLAGRLETEFDLDQALIRSGTGILTRFVAEHPEETGVAEMLADATAFSKAWTLHVRRGDVSIGENHFLQNTKAIAHWWTIDPGAALYDQARLHIARAERMLIPYFPARGTFREIMKELERTYPNNRFVRYHLRAKWDPHGDGDDYYDWVMRDYSAKVADSPEWVREIYQAYQQMVDWCDWWIRFKQQPQGAIGGGWGDDVEIVGAFGYYGYISHGAAPSLVAGTGRLVNGLWTTSEVDPELGYSTLLSDAEHSAEFTGNTLGMMVQIDHGNPLWIERSLKTAKLMRDLWTDYDNHGHRRFRANFLAAAEVGAGDRMNDAWINYRAIRPAHAVWAYNRNPTIAKLLVELADGWVASAMSTDRDKPEGVIPTIVSFPDALLGGHKSPSWYTPLIAPRVINQRWPNGNYKPYIQDLLISAYEITRDAKYLEPLRLEYELAERYDALPKATSALRLQTVARPVEFGTWRYNKEDLEEIARRRGARRQPPLRGIEKGSEEWVARSVKGVDRWRQAEAMLGPRRGPLVNDVTREDVARAGYQVRSELAWRWPMHTTEAGPTDRIAFFGLVNPFFVYTGGRLGGPLLEAAVTYAGTTRDFAAAVLATDSQGLRILYHSLTDSEREIKIFPWHLQTPGRYRIRYGPDSNEDDVADSYVEDREQALPQKGIAFAVRVKPRTTYVIEIEQTGRDNVPPLLPDAAILSSDLRHSFGRILARVHNVGSAPVRHVEVAAYEGDPKAGGRLIGRSLIPHIAAPLDLDAKSTTIGFPWQPRDDEPTHIHIVVDPDGRLQHEISTLNNAAHAMLPAAEPVDGNAPPRPRPPRRSTGGRGRGR